MRSMTGRRDLPATVRFKAQYSQSENECWEWCGYCNKKGRPVISINGKQVYAHRYAYQRFIGSIPTGLYVLHTCDNIKCVNPKHLFTGTQLDNMKDMKEKGRANKPKGESNGRAKLTDDDIRFIRKNYRARHRIYGQKAMARKLGVSTNTIYEIVTGEKWSHVI